MAERIWRATLYLTVLGGSLAWAGAGGNVYWPCHAALGAMAAALTVDRERFRKLDAGASAFLFLVSAPFFYTPLLDLNPWLEPQKIVCATANYLCFVSPLAFFCAWPRAVAPLHFGATLFLLLASAGTSPDGFPLLLHLSWYGVLLALSLFLRCARVAAAPSPAAIARRGLWFAGATMLGAVPLGLAFFYLVPRLDDGHLRELRAWLAPERTQETIAEPEEEPSPHNPLDIRDLFPFRQQSPTSVSSDGLNFQPYSSSPNDPRPVFRATLRPSFVPSAAEQRFYFRGLARREIRLPAKAPAYATSFSTDAEGFADVRDDPTAPLPERRWEQNIRFLDAGDSTVYGLHPFIKVKPHGLRPSGEDGFQWAQRTAPREYTVLSAPTLFAEDIPENAVPDDSEETRIPPSDAPPELAELAQKLAAGLTHPQPALIAARIADWLRTTKRVTYAEPEEEIAAANAYDFLLSAQPARRRGRCLQYAGAMALLCRSLGLPARVAVGYAVKSEAAYERSVLVRRADAHAWVEIRWRGLGWALYDPTPGNMPLSRSGPAIPDPLPPELPSDAATQDPSALEKRDVASPAKPNADDETPAAVAATGHWWQRLMKYDRNKQRRFYGWLSRWFANTAETLQALLSGWVGIALQIVAGLIVTALTFHFLRQLYLSFDRREQGMRRKHSSPRARAAVSFYNEYLRLLAKRGMHRRPGQTPREFALTIRRRGGTRFDGAAEVTRLYERVFYGGADLTQNEFNRLQTVFDGLREAALFDVTIDAEITDGDRQP